MRSLPRRLAATAALATCAACTVVGPDYERPEIASPQAFAEAKARGVDSRPAELDRWWASLRDPVLDGLVDRALQGNLDLQIAAARVREARAFRTVAASAYFPQIGAGASYSRTRISENGLAAGGFSGGAPPGFDPDVNLWQGGFDAAWELDVFGGTRRRVEAADARIAATVEERREVVVSLLGELARNYVEYRGYQRQLSLTRVQLESQQKTVDLTKARVEAGLSSELDLAQSRSEIELTRAKIPSFEMLSRAALYRLGVLLGSEPATLASELAADAPVPAPGGLLHTGVPSDLLQRRADVRRAERQLAAANALIGAAIAEKYPKFSINGTLGLRSVETGSFFDAASLFYSLVPSLSMPLFQGGRLDANIEIERARTEQALLSLRQTYLLALEEVENAVARYSREQDRRDSLAAAVAAQQRALDLAQALFDQGLTDFLNVLVTQRFLIERQTVLAQSDTQVSVEAVALFKALGGGWESAEPLASRPAEDVAAAQGPDR